MPVKPAKKLAAKAPAAMSQRDFARKVKAAPSTINAMVNDGRLPKLPDGKIKMPEGLAAYEEIRSNQVTRENAERAELRLAEQRAVVREREAKAQQRELALKVEREELVERAVVQADARGAAELIRSQLLALPPRVATQLEAIAAGPAGAPRAAAIEALIADEVNQVIAGIRSEFLR